jgi:hypothetical protein
MEVVTLMKEDSTCMERDTKTTQIFRSANVWKLILYIEHRNECESVAKIRDNRVAKTRTVDHVYYRNFPVP